MAQENGTIKDGTAGIIDRNLDASGNQVPSKGTIDYNTSQYSFATGTKVSYDIDDYTDPRHPVAINIKALSTAPAPPPDEGEVITGIINGNVEIPAGVTKTFKDATINGNLKVKGGKGIAVGNGHRTIINGGVNAHQGSQLVFYKATVMRTVSATNCAQFNAYYDTEFRSTVVANNNTGQGVTLKGATADGDVIVNNNSSAVVQNCHITGDLTLNNNTSCNQSGNTVDGTNSGCS